MLLCRKILERKRRAKGLPPALPVVLPDDPRVRDLAVSPHELSSYDELSNSQQEQSDDETSV